MSAFITPTALEEFARYLRAEDRSSGTIENYLRHVRTFSKWLGERPVTHVKCAEWKEFLQQQGYSAVTINSMLASLNRFLDVAGFGTCRVRPLRIQRRIFQKQERELTQEEYHSLVATARNQGRARLALLLETICATGIRVSEVRYITVEAAHTGRAEVSLKGKIRTILLTGKLCRKLLKYAKDRKIASGEIFLTRGGHSISRKQIWSEMKSVCSAAGVAPTKVFPHNLRHLFARTFYQASRDVVKLADILGHSSVETTRIYLISTGEEHAQQLEQLRLVG